MASIARGGDRRLLPRARLRAHRRGDGRRLRARDRARDRDDARLQVGAPGAAGSPRGARNLRRRRRGGPPHDRRFEVEATGRRRGRRAAARGARRRPPSRPPRPRRSSSSTPENPTGFGVPQSIGVRRANLPAEETRQGMHLKSITMKGFKSFPERTRLEFSPGVSVIVGPNGCGKSNITDAVLWALGEQSPLAVRGQTMQDVIFAGGDGQSPPQAAEVEVVIDNSDGAAPSSSPRSRSSAASTAPARRRLLAERRPLPARRRHRGARRHQPRPRDALGDQPGPGRGDRSLEAARPAPADRGGRRARQAPQAPPPRPAASSSAPRTTSTARSTSSARRARGCGR